MREEELKKLSTRNSDLLKMAIKRDHLEDFEKLIGKIPKDYLGQHASYISIITNVLAFEKKCFEESQNKIAQRIGESLKRKEEEKAIELLELKEREHTSSYNIFLDFILRLCGHILETYGQKGLYEAFRYSAQQQKSDMAKAIEVPVEANVKYAATIFKSLMGKMTIKEDETKFTFIQDPCGSGGRLLRERAYGPPKGYLRIINPEGMTLQRSNFPVWCAHCMIFNGIMMTEWFGFPLWVFEPPVEADDPCILHIYKDKDYIPEEYYEKLGTKKVK